MAILLGCEVKVEVTRIGAFVKETIAVIIPSGVDLNQEERVFLSGLFFIFIRAWRTAESSVLTARNKKYLLLLPICRYAEVFFGGDCRHDGSVSKKCN
ncbi:MAG: hypothetical protein ACYC6S_04220 [Desulfobulbia bacterium]